MSITPAIVGPVAPYSNVAIQANFYNPSRFVISGVNLGVNTTVTTTLDMNYVIGQLVRLIIPPSFGCIQLNEKTGYVLSLPAANQVVLDINSSQNVDAYIASSATTVAQILPIGDRNNGTINSNGRTGLGTYVPGSFIDVS